MSCDHPKVRYMNGAEHCRTCESIDAPLPTSRHYPAPFSQQWVEGMQRVGQQLQQAVDEAYAKLRGPYL